MKRYCFLPLVACVTMCAAQTRAMPVAGPIAAPALGIRVASGCGLGVHRGPFDGCETVYDGNYAGSGRRYFNHYYVGQYFVGSDRGGYCSGRGTHLACNSFGLCLVVCN
jgi:hypothetical protein